MKLEIEIIKNKIIPEFAPLFHNSREFIQFRNFVLTQAHIKNRLFDKINDEIKHHNVLIKHFSENIECELEGKFTYLQYILYLLPEYSKLIFSNPLIIGDFKREINMPSSKIVETKKNEFKNFIAKFNKYSTSKFSTLTLLLQNNVKTTLDIKKVEYLFELYEENLSIFEVLKEFDFDWTYFFIILKKIITEFVYEKKYFYPIFETLTFSTEWIFNEQKAFSDESKTISKSKKLEFIKNNSDKIFDFLLDIINTDIILEKYLEPIVHEYYKENFFDIYLSDKTILYNYIREKDFDTKKTNKLFNTIDHVVNNKNYTNEKNYGEIMCNYSYYFSSIVKLFNLDGINLKVNDIWKKEHEWKIISVNSASSYSDFDTLRDLLETIIYMKKHILKNNNNMDQFIKESFDKNIDLNLKTNVELNMQDISKAIESLIIKFQTTKTVERNCHIESLEALFYAYLLKTIGDKPTIGEIKSQLQRIRTKFFKDSNMKRYFDFNSEHGILFMNPVYDESISKIIKYEMDYILIM